MLNYPTLRILKSDFRPMLRTHKKRLSVCLNPQGLYSQICLFYKLVTEGSRTKIQFSYPIICIISAIDTTFVLYHSDSRSNCCNYHHNHPPLAPIWASSSVNRAKMDQIRRSWVRFPPRSKTVFFASCGSLFPYQG